MCAIGCLFGVMDEQILRGVRSGRRQGGLLFEVVGRSVDAGADQGRRGVRRVPDGGDATPAGQPMPRARRTGQADPLERGNGPRLQRTLHDDVRSAPVPL